MELLQTGPPTEQQLHSVLDLLRFAFDIHDVFDSEQFTQLINIFFHTLQQVYVLRIMITSSARILAALLVTSNCQIPVVMSFVRLVMLGCIGVGAAPGI